MSETSPRETAVRTGEIEANGLGFSMLEAGPANGRLVLCLHGFPDSAWTYRYLLPELGAAGFHAAAPFMRGYAPTSLAPDGIYSTGALVADVVALHEVLGGGSDAVLVGHDWGAMAAYGAAAFAPDRFSRLVTGAVPPLLSMAATIFSFAQLKRSWYMFFFQSPFAPSVVAADDLAFVAGLWGDWSPGYDASFDLEKVRESLGDPGRVAAAVGYYRGMFAGAEPVAGLEAEQAATMQPTPQPVLYFHGDRDGCLGPEAVTPGLLDYVGPGSEILMVAQAGHFAHVERPDILNPAILEWATA